MLRKLKLNEPELKSLMVTNQLAMSFSESPQARAVYSASSSTRQGCLTACFSSPTRHRPSDAMLPAIVAIDRHVVGPQPPRPGFGKRSCLCFAWRVGNVGYRRPPLERFRPQQKAPTLPISSHWAPSSCCVTCVFSRQRLCHHKSTALGITSTKAPSKVACRRTLAAGHPRSCPESRRRLGTPTTGCHCTQIHAPPSLGIACDLEKWHESVVFELVL